MKYAKLFEALSNVRNPENEVGVPKTKSIMDVAYVLMVVAKNEKAERILGHFSSPGQEERKKVPELEYVVKDVEPVKQKFSNKYFNIAWDIMKASEEENINNDSCTLFWLKKDYPITLENENFKVIMGPREEED